MPGWFMSAIGSLFFVGMENLFVRGVKARKMLKGMLFGLLAYAIAAALGLVAVVSFVGSLFFYLAAQNQYVLPAIWSGLFVILLALLVTVWGGYSLRSK